MPREKTDLIEPPEHPWDRQSNETKLAWRAFTVYRDLGAERTLVKVGKRLGKKTQAKIEIWSSKNRWVARCAAFDAWMDKQNRKADLEVRIEMRKRHADFSKALQALAATALNKMLHSERKTVKIEDPATGKLIDVPSPSVLRPSEMHAIAALGMSEERKALDVADSVVETRGSVLPPGSVIINPDDLKGLTLNELRSLQDIVAKIGRSVDDDGTP